MTKRLEVEYKMPEREREEPDQNGESTGEHDSAQEALLEIASAVANVIEKEKVVDAVANWVNAHANNKPKEHRLRWGVFILGQVFGLVIFAGILFAGWHKVIGPEATTGLLGALVGYWYGQREKQK
ncbi:MAG TPA: hypothetical protein VFN26_14165 [Candidatus Acidoferrum sp.]|nr:hypothetical protein [Candidatus Acidoferrum sp.]